MADRVDRGVGLEGVDIAELFISLQAFRDKMKKPKETPLFVYNPVTNEVKET